MPEPIIVPGATSPAHDRQPIAAMGQSFEIYEWTHSYFDAQGTARYLIIMTPRLRELISALHLAPRVEHNEFMRRFDSEILE